RVVDEVGKHLANLVGVPHDRGQVGGRGQGERHSVGEMRLGGLYDSGRDLQRIELLDRDFEPARVDACGPEDVLDDAGQSVGLARDDFEEALAIPAVEI